LPSFEFVDITNLQFFAPTAQIDDNLAIGRENMNMGGQMVEQVNHDFVTIYAKDCRHKNIKSEALGFLKDS
jgi:hypothetical protein